MDPFPFIFSADLPKTLVEPLFFAVGPFRDRDPDAEIKVTSAFVSEFQKPFPADAQERFGLGHLEYYDLFTCDYTQSSALRTGADRRPFLAHLAVWA